MDRYRAVWIGGGGSDQVIVLSHVVVPTYDYALGGIGRPVIQAIAAKASGAHVVDDVQNFRVTDPELLLSLGVTVNIALSGEPD